MDRVETDVAAPTCELGLDHNKIVDMLKVFSDVFIRVSAIVASDNQIAGGSRGNLAGDMTRERKLAVVPFDLDLVTESVRGYAASTKPLTRLFLM